MRRRWIRLEAGRRENVGALMTASAVAAVAATVTFYFTRMLLAREPLSGPPVPERPDPGDPDGERGA